MKKFYSILLILSISTISCSNLNSLIEGSPSDNTPTNQTTNSNNSSENNNSNTDNNNNNNNTNNNNENENNGNTGEENPPSPSNPSTPPSPPEPSEEEPPISDEDIEVTGIEMVSEEINVYLNHTHKLKYATLPVNTSKAKIYFNSDIPLIASIDQNGIITGNQVGSTLIRAITDNGYFAYCKVNVIENPNFKFNKPCIDLYIGEKTINTVNSSSVTYSSADSSIASISSSGEIIANKVGVTTLQARSGNNLSTCDIRILEKNHSNFNFKNIDSNTCEITGFSSTTNISSSTLVLPHTSTDNKKVIKVADKSFSYYSSNKPSGLNINNIILPNSIEELGNNSFDSITDGGSSSIDYTFYFPYNLKILGEFALHRFNFGGFKLYNNLLEIRKRAFINCHAFTQIILPNKVDLKLNCFADVYRLKIPELEDTTGLKNLYIQEGATISEEFVFSGASDLLRVNIPTSFTKIPGLTFENTGYKIKQIIVPTTIQEIGQLYSYGSQLDVLLENSQMLDGYNKNNNYYLYSASSPSSSGNYWHYKNGIPTKW